MDGRVVVSTVSQLHLTSTGDTIVIEVQGVLDEATVRMIDAATTGALERVRVRVDLANVAGYTEAGAAALSALKSRFPPGEGRRIAYHASSEMGQDALLAAYTRMT